MGNTSSCTSHPNKPIKVVKEDGRVEEHRRPIRAGELMLDNPGLFVCDSGQLQVGHRVPGLAADVELEAHRRYFLLPMDMLYSVLTEEEMALLLCRGKGGCAGLRQRAAAEEGQKEVVWGDGHWRPGLDTIVESA